MRSAKISRQTASRLRKEAGVRQFGDPWERLKALPPEDLAALAEAESIEVAAVLLSKLDTAKAAKMSSLTQMPNAENSGQDNTNPSHPPAFSTAMSCARAYPPSIP